MEVDKDFSRGRSSSSDTNSILEGENIEEYSLRVLKKTYERRLCSKEGEVTLEEERSINHLLNLRERNKDVARSPRKPVIVEKECTGKENEPFSRGGLRSSSKETLKRLGDLYGDKELSSPVHKREEDIGPLVVGASRPAARSARLAALANTINNWEDDLSHPVIVKPAPERKDRFGNIIGRKSIRAEAKSNWDPKILSSLEAQGFQKCNSKEHLVYDYKSPKKSPAKCGAKDKGSPRLEKAASPAKPQVASETLLTHPVRRERSRSPLRRVPEVSGSPRKVIEMAAQFESSPVRDPAELPLHQRKALFDRPGAPPLKPKAPLTQPLPPKLLAKKSVSFTPNISSGRGVAEKVAQFGAPQLSKLLHDPVKEDQERRAQELEMLKHMWRRPEATKSAEVAPPAPEPAPSPPTPPPPPSPERKADLRRSAASYPVLAEVKKIKLSPPKPGRLYPSLSDLEVETETESERPDNPSSVEDSESSFEDNSSSDHSFGQEIVKAASSPNRVIQREKSGSSVRTTSSSEVTDESRVLQEIDDYLDEALAGETTLDLEEDLRDEPAPLVKEETKKVQLTHTISVYRKQKGSIATVMTTVHRDDQSSESEEEDHVYPTPSMESEVSRKIDYLLTEVSRQTAVISQATQALNLCNSTIEFTGSTEEIEGEKLLLIASARRQAALNELQRLRVEGTLGSIGLERGNLRIDQIELPVKLDVLRSLAREEKSEYLVILARSGAEVVPSELIQSLPKNTTEQNKVVFKKPLAFDGLFSDFTVSLEVYGLVSRSKELLPHEIKYHITPKKEKKRKLRLIESPAGPNSVRSTRFRLLGFVVFALRDLHRASFTLNKVPYGSIVEGTLQLRVSCDLALDSRKRGFLTMFEDVSGFGAWHRRWCLLQGETISYWKYPDDETKKVALDSVDLSSCTTVKVGPVPREICARPNTFMLETLRPPRANDRASLVMSLGPGRTKVRHLISADTRQDMSEWVEALNRTLALLRVWGKNTSL